MHGKVAAGKISVDRLQRRRQAHRIAAKIVDDDEWRKIEEGVYTGFSQGGAYVKRWPDPENPEFTRYTASPSEISLVDLPCLPEASFELVKADGASETARLRRAVRRRRAESRQPELGLARLAGRQCGQRRRSRGNDRRFLRGARSTTSTPIRSMTRRLTALLARLKARCVAALQPRAAQKVAMRRRPPGEAREPKASRRAEPPPNSRRRLAELTERVTRWRQLPAPPSRMPGFAPVSKTAGAGLDDLAAELARLSPEQASLVLIKAAQSQPKRFG